MRATFSESSLPEFLWPDIAEAQCYLLNHGPVCTQNNQIPMNIFFKIHHKINVSHFQVLGCQCFFKIKTNNKLSGCSVKAFLLGYEPNCKEDTPASASSLSPDLLLISDINENVELNVPKELENNTKALLIESIGLLLPYQIEKLPDVKEWKAVINSEMQSLLKNGTWLIVDRNGQKTIGT
ncbi:hypothetical protein HMI56_003155 [Coelomomyces lativittatus]|nr:hypothetical protein HMI56_003155 [Coelomomyces lativittatus]